MKYTLTIEGDSGSESDIGNILNLLYLLRSKYELIDVRPGSLPQSTVSYDAKTVRAHLEGTIDESIISKLRNLSDKQLEAAAIAFINGSGSDFYERFHYNTLDILDAAIKKAGDSTLEDKLKEISFSLAEELSLHFADPNSWNQPDKIVVAQQLIARELAVVASSKEICPSLLAEKVVFVIHGLTEIKPNILEIILNWAVTSHC